MCKATWHKPHAELFNAQMLQVLPVTTNQDEELPHWPIWRKHTLTLKYDGSRFLMSRVLFNIALSTLWVIWETILPSNDWWKICVKFYRQTALANFGSRNDTAQDLVFLSHNHSKNCYQYIVLSVNTTLWLLCLYYIGTLPLSVTANAFRHLLLTKKWMNK